ncbi:MAG: hypothetical protein HGA69_00460 [Desulfobulbaceae bacterium]|nr:hypothetical protein [Desulfobulbaceae bacterium]
MRKQERWPKWETVLETWNQAAVPNIDIVTFSIKDQHYPGLPWFDKKRNRQYIGASSPQLGTAYHLCKVLPEQHAEFQVAYKLYAFCRYFDLYGFSGEVLHPVFVKNESAFYEWWNGNARYVLPPFEYRINYERFDSLRTACGWTFLMECAAEVWKEIAANWAVIKIPAYMETDSPEYAQYKQFEDKKYEQREREEFERLKKKFGSGSGGE